MNHLQNSKIDIVRAEEIADITKNELNTNKSKEIFSSIYKKSIELATENSIETPAEAEPIFFPNNKRRYCLEKKKNHGNLLNMADAK